MTPQKLIVFDASTLITLAMNGLLEELRRLKEIFSGQFIITREVKTEIIDRPLTIKRFELEALKLQELLNDDILTMPSSIGIEPEDIAKRTKEILNVSNSIFIGKKEEIHLIDLGEASCLALSKILNMKKIKHIIAIDERTTRMLCEKPENLEKLLKKKLHTGVISKKDKFRFFEGFNIIRSSELMYVAYKKGLVRLKGELVLDALLYALKFKGCAISNDEIEEIKRMK